MTSPMLSRPRVLFLSSRSWLKSSTSWSKMAVRAPVITSHLPASWKRKWQKRAVFPPLWGGFLEVAFFLTESWPSDHIQCRRSQIMQTGIWVATGYPSRFPVLLLQKRQENIGRRVTDAGTTAKYSPIYAKIRAIRALIKGGNHRCELSFSPWRKSEHLLEKLLLENKSLVVDWTWTLKYWFLLSSLIVLMQAKRRDVARE